MWTLTTHTAFDVTTYTNFTPGDTVNTRAARSAPHSWSMTLDLHLFHLNEVRDAWWYSNGRVTARDRDGNSGRFLGREADVVITYVPNPTWHWQFGLGHFSPGTFARSHGLEEKRRLDLSANGPSLLKGTRRYARYDIEYKIPPLHHSRGCFRISARIGCFQHQGNLAATRRRSAQGTTVMVDCGYANAIEACADTRLERVDATSREVDAKRTFKSDATDPCDETVAQQFPMEHAACSKLLLCTDDLGFEGSVDVCIRPEHFILDEHVPIANSASANRWRGRVTEIRKKLTHVEVVVVGPVRAVIHLGARSAAPIAVGDELSLYTPPAAIRLFHPLAE